jgi:hypothetical protein
MKKKKLVTVKCSSVMWWQWHRLIVIVILMTYVCSMSSFDADVDADEPS